MTNYIYRAQVQNGGETITYHNSNGQKVTYNPDQRTNQGQKGLSNMQKDAALLFNTINKYFTGDNPNITPQEQVQLRADIAKQRIPQGGYTNHNLNVTLDIYEGIDFVLNTFSSKNSEGGENITPNEVYQIFEIFHNWTK